MEYTKKFAIRLIADGKKKRIKQVDNLEAAEEWIDKALKIKINDPFARNLLLEAKGRIKKNGPIVSLWTSTPLLSNRKFKAVVIETKNL